MRPGRGERRRRAEKFKGLRTAAVKNRWVWRAAMASATADGGAAIAASKGFRRSARSIRRIEASRGRELIPPVERRGGRERPARRARLARTSDYGGELLAPRRRKRGGGVTTMGRGGGGGVARRDPATSGRARKSGAESSVQRTLPDAWRDGGERKER